MHRVSLSITLVFASILVTACGGGGDSRDPSSGQGTTITASSTKPAEGSSSCSDSLAASGAVTMSLEELPYCDPAPLEEIMAMDDTAYQNQLSNHWPDVERLLHRYIPPNVTVYPAPRNFSGAMASCLQQHGLLACREYMGQLIGLNKGKQP